MIPVIAIVGRPNVGKSTLFNRLTRRRDALVANFSGLTRDRQYGEGRYLDKAFILIDTGGIGEGSGGIDDNMTQQSMQAVVDADIVFFMVDGRAGLTPSDETIAQQLRSQSKKVILVVNKVDTIDADVARAEFYQTGFALVYPIAAVHGRGVGQLMVEALAPYEAVEIVDEEANYKQHGTKLAIIGRPNVGKSTLVNRMLGEERVIVYDMPGTTRDSIYIPLERLGKQYTLIDTAGVRKRGRVTETVEKFSVVKTLQAIEDADVVIVVLDAQESVTEQDMHLLNFAITAGRALVVAINKWDGLSEEHKENIRIQIQRRLDFVKFARMRFISALHGTGVGHLFGLVDEAYQTATQSLQTSRLTQILQAAVIKHQPPMVNGRRIKLRYAHQGGRNPLTIVIHGNQAEAVSASYQRYLSNAFRDGLKLVGAPLYLQFKTGENPYKNKRNQLTPRQLQKRKRLKEYTKK